MTRLRQIAITDSVGPDKRPVDLVQDVIRETIALWSHEGAAGIRIIHATWDAGVLTLCTEPGRYPLTVEKLRDVIQVKRGTL